MIIKVTTHFTRKKNIRVFAVANTSIHMNAYRYLFSRDLSHTRKIKNTCMRIHYVLAHSYTPNDECSHNDTAKSLNCTESLATFKHS